MGFSTAQSCAVPQLHVSKSEKLQSANLSKGYFPSNSQYTYTHTHKVWLPESQSLTGPFTNGNAVRVITILVAIRIQKDLVSRLLVIASVRVVGAPTITYRFYSWCTRYPDCFRRSDAFAGCFDETVKGAARAAALLFVRRACKITPRPVTDSPLSLVGQAQFTVSAFSCARFGTIILVGKRCIGPKPGPKCLFYVG